ncbi:MAG: hypothetical protein AB7P40_20445 [Chloroflexota bacterium]
MSGIYLNQGDPLRGMAMAVLMMGTTTVGLLVLQRVARPSTL